LLATAVASDAVAAVAHPEAVPKLNVYVPEADVEVQNVVWVSSEVPDPTVSVFTVVHAVEGAQMEPVPMSRAVTATSRRSVLLAVYAVGALSAIELPLVTTAEGWDVSFVPLTPPPTPYSDVFVAVS